VFIADEVRDAVCDDTRFSAASTCKDQKRSFGSGNGFTLWGVKAGKKVHELSFSQVCHYTGEMAWTALATVRELPNDSVIEVEYDGSLYAICNAGGEFRAIAGVCPHQGGPLGQGTVIRGIVVCPWHAWEFDSNSGACLVDDRMMIPTYPVRVEDARVLVNLPENA
jgi:nitrite reductase (NADH) small subunit